MDAVSRRCWGDMEPVGDCCGVVEMLVQGVDVFQNAASSANNEIVDCDDVLGVLREGDSADMLETTQSGVQYRTSNPPLLSLWMTVELRLPDVEGP